MFQFLIGRLDTKEEIAAEVFLKAFQFLIGRLDTYRYGISFSLEDVVSIPHR